MKFQRNRPPKGIMQANKRRALREWHSKFAWWPTIVDETDENYSRVWGEKYMRQQRIGPTSPHIPGNGSYFVKYSKKEFFKKKLNGDFNVGGLDEDMQKAQGATTSYTGMTAGPASVSVGTLMKALNSPATAEVALNRTRKRSK